MRTVVSIKCGHPLKFNGIVVRNVAQVESDKRFYLCNTARNIACNNLNGGHTMLSGQCAQYCVQCCFL